MASLLSAKGLVLPAADLLRSVGGGALKVLPYVRERAGEKPPLHYYYLLPNFFPFSPSSQSPFPAFPIIFVSYLFLFCLHFIVHLLYNDPTSSLSSSQQPLLSFYLPSSFHPSFFLFFTNHSISTPFLSSRSLFSYPLHALPSPLSFCSQLPFTSFFDPLPQLCALFFIISSHIYTLLLPPLTQPTF